MKINDKENKKLLLGYKINLALSVIVLVLASFWVLQNIYEGRPYYAGNSLIWVLLGLILLVSACMNIKRTKAELEGKIIADERSRRAAERAGFFAFFLLIACLIVSGLINSIFNLNLEYTLTVNVIMVAVVFAWIILARYLDRKGAAL